MQFDFTKTLSLIKGGLLDHQNTWNSYLEENPGWQQTALQLTGPLLIANVLLSLIFSRLVGGYSMYGYQSGWFSGLIIGLVMGAIGFVIAVLVFNFLAGIFKGAPNFPRAFAAVSLAAIPAWLAGAISGLIPYLGFLLLLAGGILSLVFLYRIMPQALGVPEDKRVVHFVVSLVTIFVCNMIIGLTLGFNSMANNYQANEFSPTRTSERPVAASGVVGEIARQGELIQAASADRFEPPADGELDERQVENYVSVLRKTRVIHAEYEAKMEKLAADMKEKEAAGKSPSLSDLTKIYSGAGSAMGANNAEMEVVKSGGGNWAEHEWVKAQLRAAHYQQGEGSDALAHNFELYQKYQEDLNDG